MPKVTVREVEENIYLFTERELGFFDNCTVIMTEVGPVVIDVFRDQEQFQVVREFLSDRGCTKPVAIIYTHWHTDHTCGNQIFTGCPVYAHQGTLRHLQGFIDKDLERLIQKGVLGEGTQPVLPTVTFEDTYQLHLGECHLELIHCPGHTYDSILIYDRAKGVLITGDTILSAEVPFFLPPVIPPDEVDADPAHLQGAYQMIEDLQPKVLIPGHGSTLDPGELLKQNQVRYEHCLTHKLKMLK